MREAIIHSSSRSIGAEPLWRIGDVATFLGVPVATLYQWRRLGSGPPAYRLGKHLRYRRFEVEAWVAKQGG